MGLPALHLLLLGLSAGMGRIFAQSNAGERGGQESEGKITAYRGRHPSGNRNTEPTAQWGLDLGPRFPPVIGIIHQHPGSQHLGLFGSRPSPKH